MLPVRLYHILQSMVFYPKFEHLGLDSTAAVWWIEDRRLSQSTSGAGLYRRRVVDREPAALEQR